MLHMKSWLKNHIVATAIGCLVVILIIWGVGWAADLTPVVLFAATLMVLLIAGIYLLVRHMRARKAGGQLEGMLRRQANDAVINSGSDTRSEVTLVRQRLLAAIELLKSSKLGKTRGRAALYELPWYMIIGHPAAGKSSAVLQSGLTFPFGEKQGVQGVGGTRNCDWFFSTEGILLDTAGRYASNDSDRGEWTEFLKLLKKHRPKAPANGIVVALSLQELLKHQGETFEEYAQKVRSRIDEMTSVFQMPVPVYLVFTKLDLLPGFAQFFQEADENERAQVWGATFSADQGAGFDLEMAVSQQFDGLTRGLQQAGESRLLQYRGRETKAAFYAFPIEFRNLKEAVLKFTRLLCQKDPYHTNPLVRGFYFTSALQQGLPEVGAARRVQSRFGIIGGGQASGSGSPASYSYFLRNLFREVIFPDQHLISNQPQVRPNRWRIAGMAAGLLTLSLFAGLWTWSYIGNEHFLEQTFADRAQARQLEASPQLCNRLRGLALLQKRLEMLQQYRKHGAPWQIGLGLYQGNGIEQSLRREYFDGVRELMLTPVKESLESTLGGLRADAAAAQPAVSAPVVEQTAKPKESKAAPVAAVRAKPVAHHHRSSGAGTGNGNALPVIKLGEYHAVPSPYRQVDEVVGPGRADGYGYVQASYQTDGGQEGFHAMRVADVVPVSGTSGQVTAAIKAPAPAPVSPAAAAQAAQRQNQLDIGYNALKTYLMLHDSRLMEEAQLTAQLPRYWRPWLEARKGEYTDDEIMPLAEQMIAFYVSQIGEPDIPLIDNDPNIVSNARNVLRVSFKRLSGPERVFNEIRSRANTRYAPLTVGRILSNRDLDIVTGSQMVEGAFTRQAWNEYVSKLIDEASKGEIKGDDWVLASSMAEDLGKDGNVDQNRAALLALYRVQYIDQWKKFMQGLQIRDFASPAQAASAMTRLSDPQSSPIKVLLARVTQETGWDNPSELQQTFASAQSSLVDKIEQRIGTGSGENGAGAQAQYGPVGAAFAGVARLTKGDTPPINGYLDQLTKVKNRLVSITTADNAGAQARAALKSTLSGSGSEMAEALTFVDTTLLGQANDDTKGMVRPLLVRPLMQTYSSLVGPVVQDINQAWQNEVMTQWHPLAAKYPFSNSANVASVDEINSFVRASDGTFDKFVNTYLDGLVERRGDTLVPRTWGGVGMAFNPAFLAASPRLAALGKSQLQTGGSTRFEMQPVPTPGLAEISFVLDGQELHYRNGAQMWQPFTWPGTSDQPGARIQALTYNGAAVVIANQTGQMGLLRLLASATVLQNNSDSALLSWKVKKDAGASVESVRFNFRVVSGFNPLQLISLHDLTLPERVTM
jgi:type VI secretion system protein ImpL